MENVLDGVYLWGTLVTNRTGTQPVETGYQDFATWDPLTPAAEYDTFIRFWDWLNALVSSCTDAGASVLAYCWHEAAENTQLRRISDRSPALRDRVDAFIASGQWVDLERTFKAGWITGGSTGLKAIAPLTGFHWDVDDPGGAMSMVRYAEAAAGSTEAQAWLTAYNRGDVEATLAIREWLTSTGEAWPEVPTVSPFVRRTSRSDS
jgi:predicted RecB family nuclease